VSRFEAMQRLPTESGRPMVVFAQTRLALCVVTVILAAAFGFPFGGAVGAVVGLVALPWSLWNLFLALERPEKALNPLIVLGDLGVLVVIEALVPGAYGPVRFLALALLAIHAHFQGERIGLTVASFGVVALVATSAVEDAADRGIDGERLIFYEVAFAATTLMTVALIGRFRSAESASRLRAHELTKRTLRSENEIRRKLSQALHDGPVQELIGLDMTLAAAAAAVEQQDQARAAALLREGAEITQRNVRDLRDEMLDLGPYAYDEISFEGAVERCLDAWERRYALRAVLDTEPLDLPSEVEGELFRITQEAVSNAGRHAECHNVTIRLSSSDGTLELSVSDDGKGFGRVDPLGPTQAGHIGLASMRERAELLRGSFDIRTDDGGTEILVRAPLPRRSRFGRRQRAPR
jgi:signal transduction histidine kinase